jgi:release factor glutamine methyltransferase
VPTAEIVLMPREARDHEPVVALDGGDDGLDVTRRIIEGSPHWLAPGGHLLVETGRPQVAEVIAAVAAAGLVATTFVDGRIGATVVRGVLPAEP